MIKCSASLCLLCCASFYTGCGSSDTTPTNPPIPEGVVLDDQVRELTETTITDYNATTGQITFQSSDYTQSLQPGNILLAGISETTPSGILRKVNHVQNNIVTTLPATLNDAIKSCNLQLDNIRLTPGDKRLAGKVGFDFEIPYTNVVLYDRDGNVNTTDDQVTISGILSFNSKVTAFKLEVSPSGVQEFNIQTLTTEIMSLSLNSDASTTLSRTYQLFPDIYCTPIPVGPFVLVPVIEVNAKISGGISISDADITQTASLSAGINYSDGTWTPSANYSNEFSHHTPTFSQNASTRLSIGPNVKVLVYNSAGITSGVEGYLRTEVNPSQTPWWKLYGGIQATIGAKLQIMGWLNIAEYSTGVVNSEHLLAQASIGNHAPNTPSNPSPVNNATNISLNPLLNWDCSDPDGDSITYDVFVNSDLIADDIASSQFQLLGLQSDRNYSWTIQAKDSHGLSNTYNTVWNFTTSQYTPTPLIPAGTFMMGSPTNELGRGSNETQHQVTLTHSIYVQSNEVTNLQYMELAQWAYDRGYLTATSNYLYDNLDGSTRILKRLGSGSYEISFSNGVFSCINPEHPVKYVTWYGAVAYCDWLSLQHGLTRAYNHSTWQCNGGIPYTETGYRLPTEAEWEYACRSGGTAAFANGPITYIGCSPIDQNLVQIGWYCGNAESWTHQGGQKTPNAWGLNDMHGNLYEWCNDWYGTYGGTVTDPVGPGAVSSRILRGGSWAYGAQFCRSASRADADPGLASSDVGFRSVRSAF